MGECVSMLAYFTRSIMNPTTHEGYAMKTRIKTAYNKLDKLDLFCIGVVIGSGLVFAGAMYDMRANMITDLRLIHDVEKNIDFLNIVHASGREANYLMQIDLAAR